MAGNVPRAGRDLRCVYCMMLCVGLKVQNIFEIAYETMDEQAPEASIGTATPSRFGMFYAFHLKLHCAAVCVMHGAAFCIPASPFPPA